MKGIHKKIISISLLSMVTTLHAAGYRLEFQSPSVLADAGEAAVVEDAGTNWYNSAGLVYLPQQLVVSTIGIYERTKFSGTSTAASAVDPAFNYANTNSRASSYTTPLLPAIHYTVPFKERFAFGISIVPAWGLSKNYGLDSDVRYNIDKVSTKTIDIAPSIAMKLNDQWSVGVGPDFHYFSIQSKVATLTQPVTATDSVSRYTADNWGHGFHAGVLYRITNGTRVGLNYRSKIVMNLTGYTDFIWTGIQNFSNNQFKISFHLPPTTTLSIYHELTDKFALMGTVAYDQWSVIRYYYGQNIIGPPAPGVLSNSVLRQNFHNTFDFSAGMHYKWNEKWLLRASVKYEPTPTVDSFRGLSFPDPQKIGVNLGARYQINKKLALDMLYAHVFTPAVAINDVNPLTGATSAGHTNTAIDLAGVQLVWNI